MATITRDAKIVTRAENSRAAFPLSARLRALVRHSRETFLVLAAGIVLWEIAGRELNFVFFAAL